MIKNPKPSARFSATFWTEKIIPALLALLVLGLLAVLVIIGLSLLGLTPAA